MSKGAVKFTKEDELLLKDFSSAVSKKNQVVFYGISSFVGITPIYLFYGAHQMEISDSWIVIKRGDAIAREMNRLLADDKKMSKKERDERILWKKNEIGDYEATLFTIFYNNV
uniref:Translocon-associated protein subunit gamma n=1 Tax=Meloidogyne javanica TaxID=6303 RepID=A0A915LJU6_MELJA